MKISIHKKLIEKVKAFNQKADKKTAKSIVKILKSVTRRDAYLHNLFTKMNTHIEEEKYEEFRSDMEEFWSYYGKMYGRTKEEVKSIYNKMLRKKEKKEEKKDGKDTGTNEK